MLAGDVMWSGLSPSGAATRLHGSGCRGVLYPFRRECLDHVEEAWGPYATYAQTVSATNGQPPVVSSTGPGFLK